MNKQRQSEGVKGKVLSGFFILLLIALAAVVAVIELATQLAPPESGSSESVTKLTLVSNLLSKLVEANGQGRAYITTGDKRFLSKYRKLDKGIRSLTDSLKYYSALQPEQYKRILVVDSLLKIKRSTMESFFRNRSEDDTLFNDILGSAPVQGLNDSTAGQSVSRTQPEKQGQAILDEEAEKQPFFKKIWNNITGKKPRRDSIAKIDVVPPLLSDSLIFTSNADTTIEMVKSQLRRMGEHERLSRQRNIELDLLLMRTDRIIMDEIRSVLLLFEKEEINRAISDARNSREVYRRLWYTALVLAAAGLLTMIVFVVLIWKDLARSNFYRRQLESSRALAEKLLKVKELFLANMSHEIRTPITSIIGFSERLETTRLSKEQKNYLAYINASSEHLLGLVDDLLDYSRIESGRFNLENIPFLADLLFRQSYEAYKHKAQQKGLEMHYVSNLPENMAVAGDPLRLRQILYNLLNNSLKFTEKGSISLNVECELHENRCIIAFKVGDTGIGIPADKQQEIFSEFTQVDAGITRKYGGSGLGLAICSKLVELMDGKIELNSQPGEGTSIQVELALNLFEGNIQPQVASMSPGSKLNLSGTRILLAEDDETTRMLLMDTLNQAGALTLAAPDGAEALAIFKQPGMNFHLIITDIRMPNLSGPEFINTLTAYCAENNIEIPPVLGLTAHATKNELDIFRNAGIQKFLIKPFRQQQLVDALSEILNIKPFDDDSGAGFIEDMDVEITEYQPLNLQAFTRFAGNDPEALKKILQSLRNSILSTASQLTETAEAGDYERTSLLAHRLLPNMRHLGEHDEVALLVKLEALKQEPRPDDDIIKSYIISLNEGLKRIAEMLDNEVDA